MIYLDNGATTFPKPTIVKKEIENYFVKYGANPGRGGHKMAMETAKQVYKAREDVADFFGCIEPENIVFTQNCTHGNNIVINGLLKQGDHVVISDMEHNSVARPVNLLAQNGIITYDIAKTYYDNDKTLNSFISKIKPNTRLIISMHASNVTGQVLPIAKIGEYCRNNNILFMVDAAQSGGLLDIDVERDKIDFLSVAAHKGLYATTGMGVLVAVRGDLLTPIFTGGSGSLSSQLIHPDFMPDKLECGTANTIGILSLIAGLKFIQSMGREKLYKKELELTQKLYTLLDQNKKVVLYTPYPTYNAFAPVLTFNVIDNTAEQLCHKLDRMGICLRGGLHCSPLCHQKLGTTEFGTARASIGAFNTEKEIIFLAQSVKNL